MVAAVTLGSALIGVLRGGLSARRRWKALAWSLAGENAVRCAGVGMLIAPRQPGRGRLRAVPGRRAGGGGAVALGAAVRHPGQRPGTEPARVPRRASLAQLIGQVVLTGGPVVLALVGGSPRCGHHAVRRAGAVPGAVHAGAGDGLAAHHPGGRTWSMSGDVESMRRMRRWLRIGTAGLVVLAGAGAALLGPLLLRLIFGAEVGSGPRPPWSPSGARSRWPTWC